MTGARSDSATVASPAMKKSIDMNWANASMASAPSMIGAESPASQLAIARPIAASSAPAVSAGTRMRWTQAPLKSPASSTTTDPPTSANSGERPW